MADMKTEKVRQGRTGRPVLYVLLIALALCLVVFAGLGIWGSNSPDQNIGGAANSGASTAPATSTGAATTTVSPSQSNSSGSMPNTSGAPAAPAN